MVVMAVWWCGAVVVWAILIGVSLKYCYFWVSSANNTHVAALFITSMIIDLFTMVVGMCDICFVHFQCPHLPNILHFFVIVYFYIFVCLFVLIEDAVLLSTNVRVAVYSVAVDVVCSLLCVFYWLLICDVRFFCMLWLLSFSSDDAK